MSVCLQLDHVDYMYGAAKIRVLSDVSADFEASKMYAITGPSGAGKSTLLSLLAGLDSPSKGVVRFEGGNIAETGYSRHRREHVSLVFQDHNLIDYLTPVENLRLVNPKADLRSLRIWVSPTRKRSATSCTYRVVSVNVSRSAAPWSPRVP